MERLEVAGAVYRIRLDRDPGPEAVRERAGAVPGIRRVQPEYRYSVPEPSPDGDGPARPGRRIR
ncbi:MAG: hypothetical protein GWN85_29795 [Gemmatimonadetes bacterium]|nr:hypothetical protein [Gemmatimonadota bacterium]